MHSSLLCARSCPATPDSGRATPEALVHYGPGPSAYGGIRVEYRPLVLGAGIVFARRKIIAADSSKAFSDFAFLFAIPCYLFGSLYASDLRQVFDPLAITGYLLTVLLGMVIVGIASVRLTGADASGVRQRVGRVR